MSADVRLKGGHRGAICGRYQGLGGQVEHRVDLVFGHDPFRQPVIGYVSVDHGRRSLQTHQNEPPSSRLVTAHHHHLGIAIKKPLTSQPPSRP